MIVCLCLCVCVQCSLQRPEYQHFRERFGCAHSIDAFEEISAELKGLLMVSGTTLLASYSLGVVLGGRRGSQKMS